MIYTTTGFHAETRMFFWRTSHYSRIRKYYSILYANRRTLSTITCLMAQHCFFRRLPSRFYEQQWLFHFPCLANRPLSPTFIVSLTGRCSVTLRRRREAARARRSSAKQLIRPSSWSKQREEEEEVLLNSWSESFETVTRQQWQQLTGISPLSVVLILWFVVLCWSKPHLMSL